jgi:hypothetical protein
MTAMIKEGGREREREIINRIDPESVFIVSGEAIARVNFMLVRWRERESASEKRARERKSAMKMESLLILITANEDCR